MRKKPLVQRLTAWALCAGICALATAFLTAADEPKTDAPAAKSDAKGANVPYVYDAEHTGRDFPKPEMPTLENATVIAPFPDPFAWVKDPLGKTRSTSLEDWKNHRAEIIAMLEHYEIGPKPLVDIEKQVKATWTPGEAGMPGGRMMGRGGPAAAGGISGRMTVVVTNGERSLTLNAQISIPAGAKAPYPIIIGMNSGTGGLPQDLFTSRGIATCNYQHNQTTTYNSARANDPFFQLYPNQTFSSQQAKGNTGQYAAWAWGVSRLIDGFTLIKDQLPIDMKHIAVSGCSYAGKMALFAGAMDERVALTVAYESGGGGATNWRYSAQESNKANGDLSVEGIHNTNHSWFASQMFDFAGARGKNVSKLPEDHHMLAALCAPRALIVTGNTGFEWLSNPSLYVNSKAVLKVYETLGVPDRFGYTVDGNHMHCQMPASQRPSIEYFLDKFMLDKRELSKQVEVVPANYSSINADRWTAWWGTGNADLPPAK